MIKAMLIAGCGGFVGTCLRYLTGKLCEQLSHGGGFPWGTFVVNVVGSFLIGVLFGLAEERGLLSSQMSLLLITGFCGGFTTFSTFADDMFLMLGRNQWALFVAYVVGSLALGLTMVWLGRKVIV